MPENPRLITVWNGISVSDVTLRDLFAMHALVNALKTTDSFITNHGMVAKEAYKYADAMLKVREETNE